MLGSFVRDFRFEATRRQKRRYLRGKCITENAKIMDCAVSDVPMTDVDETLNKSIRNACPDASGVLFSHLPHLNILRSVFSGVHKFRGNFRQSICTCKLGGVTNLLIHNPVDQLLLSPWPSAGPQQLCLLDSPRGVYLIFIYDFV